MFWIDTHAHLAGEEFKDDIQDVILRAKEVGVGTILLIGVGVEGSKRALALAKTDSIFKVAVGFHPEEVDEIKTSDWPIMIEMMERKEVIAIGEIGLDHYWVKDHEVHKRQEELFIKQIEIANRLNKPILVHMRDASEVTYHILKEHKAIASGILHCYSGSLEMAREYIKCGYDISLAGPVTFKNAHTPKEVAQFVDLNHLHIETDAPYLSPTPHRGKRNESSYVIETAAIIASLRNIPLDDLKKTLFNNFNRLFNL